MRSVLAIMHSMMLQCLILALVFMVRARESALAAACTHDTWVGVPEDCLLLQCNKLRLKAVFGM